MPKKKSRKRANGDGSVFFRKSKNRWYCQISIRQPDGTTKQISRTTKSREEARQKLIEIQSSLTPRESVTDASSNESQILLGDYLDTWLRRNPQGFAETTLYGYELACENHIKPHLESYQINELTHEVIEEWLAALLASGVGATTRVRSFSTLSSAMTQAVKDKIIPANPLRGIDRPSEPKADIQPFTESEVHRILKFRRSHDLYAAFLLPFMCGLRQGEMFGLEWRDIDFENRTIQIERQAAELRGEILIRPPKWNSYRTVSMTDSVYEAFLQRKKIAMAIGSDLVLSNRNGKHVRRSNFGNRHWKPTLKKLGIRHRGCHHARHTCITSMLNRGVPIHVVSRLAGHRKPSTTLNIYSHLMSDDSRIAAKAMDSYASGNGHVADQPATIIFREA